MRYLIFIFTLFLFSNNSIAGVPNCASGVEPQGYMPWSVSDAMNSCAASGGLVVNHSTFSCQFNYEPYECQSFACASGCSCPEGEELTTVDGITTCAPPPACEEGEVFYLDMCRPAADSPSDCGETSATAIEVDGQYVCSSNEDCPAGMSASFYTDSNGTWTVCSDGSATSSADANSSAANSSSGSNTSDGGGDGGDGGSGGDNGGGGNNGGGSASSASSNSGGSGTGSSAQGSSSGSGSGSSSGDDDGGVALTDCDVQPSCTDGSPECAILYQQWHARCGGEFDESIFDMPEDEEETTFANSLEEFSTELQESTNVQLITDFFTFNGSGSCPIWSVDVWVFSIVIDQQCSDIIPWEIISGILIAVSCLLAARIAFT